MNIRDQIRKSICSAIKQCRLSRHQIADQISVLTGNKVTVTTIDSWTAKSKPQNRIPAEYVPAFCKVTDNFDLLIILDEAAGRVSMCGPDVIRSEIQQWAEQERKARSEKRKREIFLREIEGN